MNDKSKTKFDLLDKATQEKLLKIAESYTSDEDQEKWESGQRGRDMNHAKVVEQDDQDTNKVRE